MYNFSKLTNRKETDSLKWDVAKHELPMWVADMDFETLPEVKQVLIKRAEHGIFGYAAPTDSYYQSVIHWLGTRHDFHVEKDWIIPTPGIVTALKLAVRAYTKPSDNVMIMKPVYYPFDASIQLNGRTVIECPLSFNGKQYICDFDVFEQQIVQNNVKMFILCHPHNPIGKIWSQETLQRIGDLAAQYHVVVVSDEIHCDIVTPGKEYVPFASVSQTNLMNSITCIAPTKTFNLAGLQTSCIVVPNAILRHKVNRAINTDEVAEPNSFAITASITAFEKGGKWLEELKSYIESNKQMAHAYIKTYLPELHVTPSEATYLLWIDCSHVCKNSLELVEFIRSTTGLYLSSGEEYGKNAKSFIRMNIACPQERLNDGLKRLRQGIGNYKKGSENYE